MPPDVLLRHVTSGPALRERIRLWIDPEALNGACMFHSAAEVLEIIGIVDPSRSQLRHCSAVLRDLLGPPDRIGDRSVWPVPFRANH